MKRSDLEARSFIVKRVAQVARVDVKPDVSIRTDGRNDRRRPAWDADEDEHENGPDHGMKMGLITGQGHGRGVQHCRARGRGGALRSRH